MPLHANQSHLISLVASRHEDLISAAQHLVTVPSPNPPGDTSLVAEAAYQLLKKITNAEVTKYTTAPGIVNVVARISSGRPGKRLVFNGHLDTYPICEHLGWTVPPLGGLIKDKKLYGRGITDMKGGIAASITAAAVLAEQTTLWSGEIVVTLAGDEESMGSLGTQWLLENVPIARGDAMVCGDVGSPNIIRFGEKGLCWVEITTIGVSAHGAHVHKGINAVDRLRKALDIVKLLEELPVHAPEVAKAIALAHNVSEAASGKGESETLQHVTVNIGCISGGTLLNLIPSEAKGQCDIRLPIGISLATVKKHLQDFLGPMEGVSWRILQSYEPTYTPPSHPIVEAALSASALIVGQEAAPVVNMRVGASDARLYRAAGIPSVIIGCTPHGMGAADEYVEIDELLKVSQIHTLIAYDFLKAEDI